MRIILAMLFLVLPLAAQAGVVFEIEVKDHDTGGGGGESLYMEGKNLKLEIAPGGKPNRDVVLIRRADGGITVLLIDHLGRSYGEGTLPASPRGLSLMPTGRIKMALGGINLHVGGGASDLWIQTPDTGQIGEILHWLADYGKLRDSFVDEFDAFDDLGFLEDETLLRHRERRRLDPADFEPPAGYKRRSMLYSGGGSTGGGNAGTGTTTSGTGAAVSSSASESAIVGGSN